MSLSRWTASQIEAGGHVRRMFEQGQRLRAEHGADSVADLALGQPLEPPERVRAAFRAAAAERQPGRHAYMPNLGYPEVRERAAEEVASPGVDGSCVVITGGAAGAICLALRAFVDPGSTVLAVAPYFSEYRLYTETSGCQFTVAQAAGDGHLDIAAIAAALTPATAVVLLNSPCNPSGQLVGAHDHAALAEVLADHHDRHGVEVLVVVDEVYRQLIWNGSPPVDPLRFHPRTVLARSFSKDLGLAGERIGYLVLHPSMVDARTSEGLQLAQRALGFVNAPATAQRALLHLDDWRVDLGPYRALRDLATQRAEAAGLDLLPPDGGLYLWARAPHGDGLGMVGALAERRVLIAPGVAFGAPEYVRLCFSHPPAAIERAFAAIGELIAEDAHGPGGKGGIRTLGGAQHPSPA